MMRAPASSILRATARLHPRLPPQRHFSLSLARLSAKDVTTATGRPTTEPLADGGGTGAKGRTGGGEALGSSSPNAPPQPKVFNASVSGSDEGGELTEEQQSEVDEHNRQFAKKHDRGHKAQSDKVDEKFWNPDTTKSGKKGTKDTKG